MSKAEEKIACIVARRELLSEDFGEYSLRRAVKRWSRQATLKKYRAEDRKKQRDRSVWAPVARFAVERAKG